MSEPTQSLPSTTIVDGVPTPRSSGLGQLGAVAAALLAAGVVWGVLGWKHEFFSVDSEKFGIGMGASNDARLRLFAEEARILRLNALVTFAIAGGVFGIALSLIGNNRCSLSTRGIAGVVWGTVWGAASGFLGAMAFGAIEKAGSETFGPVEAIQAGLAHGSAWAIFGAGLGLMFGGYRRLLSQMVQGTIIGAIGGLLGGIGFSAAGVLIPSHATHLFLPTDVTVRMLWLGIPFVLIALLLPMMVRTQTARPA